MAEAEAVLLFVNFWFNLLIWSQSVILCESRSKKHFEKVHEVNVFEMTIKTKMTKLKTK